MSRAAVPMRDAERDLPDLERAWMEAWRLKDRATCDGLIADDFLLTSARGVLMPKSQWLDGAMGPFVCETFEWEEIRVRAIGDVGIVHARARQRAHVSGQDWSGLFLLTDVWAYRGGKWQVVSRHGTGPLLEKGHV
jgi:ketosteroid isomerase-like protein